MQSLRALFAPPGRVTLDDSVADFLLLVRHRWQPGQAAEIVLGKAFLARAASRSPLSDTAAAGLFHHLEANDVSQDNAVEMIRFLAELEG